MFHYISYETGKAMGDHCDDSVGSNQSITIDEVFGGGLRGNVESATTTERKVRLLQDQQRREAKRQEAQNEIRKDLSISPAQCALAVIAYLLFSVLCYSVVFERWGVIESCYFGVSTFTTVGYGDFVPDSDISRLFTCIYALSGVACVGVALGVLGNQLIAAQDVAARQANKLHDEKLLKAFGESASNASNSFRKSIAKVFGSENNNYNPATTAVEMSKLGLNNGSKTSTSTSTSASSSSFVIINDNNNNVKENNKINNPNNNIQWNVDEEDVEETDCSNYKLFSVQTERIALRLILFVGSIIIIAALIRHVEGKDWTFATTLYYAIVTACTIGYGDLHPETTTGRLLSILFIPLSVGATGHWIGMVAKYIIEHRQNQFENLYKDRELSEKDLEVMDIDGDGEVTFAEFLEFMLIAMNKVDRKLLKQLRNHFARLDVDGTGVLDKDDIAEIARRKLNMKSITTDTTTAANAVTTTANTVTTTTITPY